MSKFLIAGATKVGSQEFFDRMPLGKSIKKHAKTSDFDMDIYYHNTRGLSEVYNEILGKHISGKDYVIFAHDDVYVNDIFLFDKLEDGFKSFDIIGVAGSRCLNMNHDTVAWHTCDDRYKVGGCVHPVIDRQDSQFYYTPFGKAPERCLLIDGLFMAVNLKTIGNTRFENQFTFDFYDLAFCLEAYKNGLKTGVMPIVITHISHGDGIDTVRYKRLQGIFVAQYSYLNNTVVGEPIIVKESEKPPESETSKLRQFAGKFLRLCPSRNEIFCSRSRHAKILTAGIYCNISRIKI